MGYKVVPVERDLLPDGTEWMFIQRPNGDAYFAIARDAGPIEISADVVCAVLEPVADATGVRLSLVG